jgi:hypothetical protein
MDDPTNTRQRIDYVPMADGSVKAILTISFPGGIVKRFEAVTSPDEAKEVSGALSVVSGVSGVGCCAGEEVGISFFKRLGRIAKGVASSKVFAIAAKGLAIAAPLLGPIAPFALGAAATMGVASKLSKAGVAAAHGAHDVAKALTASAHGDAKKLTRTPAGAAALLAAANKKRLGAEKIASKGDTPAPAQKIPKAKASSSSSSAPPRGGEPDLLAAAAAGRVRSNRPGAINPKQLLAAHQEGRIYWVS